MVEVHLENLIPYRNHPKYVVRIDMHIVVVNLLRDAGRSDRTGIQIQSNKDESPLVAIAVRPDVFSLTESHVGLIR
jgi:hypothetical protein